MSQEHALPRRESPADEEALLRRWDAIALEARVRAHTAGGPRFLLGDAPSPATDGLTFTGMFNRLLKDFTVKYHAMRGEDVAFTPGWDAHGLFLEIMALRTFAVPRHAVPVRTLRQRCGVLARQHCTRQREELMRLGVRADWQRPALTLYPVWEAAVLERFGRLVAQERVTRLETPVAWCPECQATLGRAETAWRPRPTPVAWVAFPAAHWPREAGAPFAPERLALAVRTDRLWQLPGVTALTAGAGTPCLLVTDRADNEAFVYLVTQPDYADFVAEAAMRDPAVLAELPGAALAGAVPRHPLTGETLPLRVVETAGVRALAPAHDADDFALARRLGVPVRTTLAPDETPGEAERRILRQLEQHGVLLAGSAVPRPAPHCWRCGQPVVIRPEPRWFVRLDQHLARVADIHWTAGETARLAARLAPTPEVRVSSRRGWGVPVPAFTCNGCGTPLLSPEVISHVAARVRAEGSDIWYAPSTELLPAGTSCPACGGMAFTPGAEVFDRWFIAAHGPEAEPADLLLEERDALHGWLAEMLHTTPEPIPPCRVARAHGAVIDRLPRTARRGVVLIPEPADLITQYGADVLRWWAATVDARHAVVLSDDALDGAVTQYRRLRGVLRTALAALEGYDSAPVLHPATSADRWLLDGLSRLVETVTASCDAGTFHRATQAVRTWTARSLVGVYLTAARPRLRAGGEARRTVQGLLGHALEVLALLLAPTVSFLADELWTRLPGADRPLSVQLAAWPAPPAAWRDDALASRWAAGLAACRRIRRALGGQPYRKILLYSAGETRRSLESLEDALTPLLGVDAVELAPRDAASPTALLCETDLVVADASTNRTGME